MKNKIYIYSIFSLVENPVNNTISDQAICPMCKELKLNPKITNCINNCQFSVCGECARKIYKCPMCQNSPEWNNDLFIEQLLPTIDFQCQECQKIFHVDDLKSHYYSHNLKDAINKNKIIIDEKNILKDETNKNEFNHVGISSNEGLFNNNIRTDGNPESIIPNQNLPKNWKYSMSINFLYYFFY